MDKIRNIAIIAHVDHGKTTLVDCLLKQSGMFRENQILEERAMDSMDLEREKGITIRAKNARILHHGCQINIVDTPGHADFGGEVERVMNMIDGVVLVVDAVEGPQAQTRFVLRKALESGARPILVINKIDREHADPARVLDEVFDLFLHLAASDEQLDFPVIYASAKEGTATLDLNVPGSSIEPLFEAIVRHTPPPRCVPEGDFKMLVANLDYSDYLGRIAIGKIMGGAVRIGDSVVCLHGDGRKSNTKVSAILSFSGMKQIQVPEAHAGDIVGLTGCEEVSIGETLAAGEWVEPLPFVPIDPPTIRMQFAVNDGPLAGRDGNLLTVRHLRERLLRETRTNISLTVQETEAANILEVSARGEMQIAVLVEQMRREGFELLVSRPEVIYHQDAEGRRLEPYETLYLELPNNCLGSILENLAFRRADIQAMHHEGDLVHLEARIPTRGLIGFETDLVNSTRGLGVMSHLFHEYAPYCGEIPSRRTGSLVSMETGIVTAYALNDLQERGRLMISPGDRVYPGMIVGEHCREQDLTVNPCRTKKLTNMRSSGEGKGIMLSAPIRLTLEWALEYIASDEYVEATPHHLRLRKKILDETARKRQAQARPKAVAA